MALLEEAALKQQIKTGALARLYVICGKEEYLKQHYTAQLCAAAVEADFRDFNFHRFEGKELTLDTLSQAVEAMPLMGTRTSVLVRDFGLESAAGEPEFLALLTGLPAHCVLVFWMDTVEWKPKKSKALLEAINTHGHAVECSAPDAAQTQRLVLAGVKNRGCTIDSPTAQYFIEAVGADLNGLQNEMEKLCAYAGQGSITRQHIDAVCIKSVDAKSFDMVKAVAAGDGAAALRLLDELFRQKVAPQMLLGSLAANYVDLFRVAVARKAGKPAEAPASLFDYKGKLFRLQNAGRMAQRMPLPRILQCLEILEKTDQRLKSGGMEHRMAMEVCIAGLLGVR